MAGSDSHVWVMLRIGICSAKPQANEPAYEE